MNPNQSFGPPRAPWRPRRPSYRGGFGVCWFFSSHRVNGVTREGSEPLREVQTQNETCCVWKTNKVCLPWVKTKCDDFFHWFLIRFIVCLVSFTFLFALSCCRSVTKSKLWWKHTWFWSSYGENTLGWFLLGTWKIGANRNMMGDAPAEWRPVRRPSILNPGHKRNSNWSTGHNWYIKILCFPSQLFKSGGLEKNHKYSR